MTREAPLKVAIDCGQVIPNRNGGVASMIASLVGALGELSDGSDHYTIVVNSQEQYDWLKPLLGPNQRLSIKRASDHSWQNPNNSGGISFTTILKRALGPMLPAARRLQKLINIPRHWPEVPISDGIYEKLECDVIHFATQSFTLCAIPSIYNPHDLQHLHYPQFWTPADIAFRETIYPAGCRFSHTVIVGSQWVKDDVVRQYQISPDKVQVIPEGPPGQAYCQPTKEFLAKIKEKYRLEQPFAVYPAVTWPHKNHIRLLDALARLRDAHGLTVRLICTGARDEKFWPDIAKCIEAQRLGSQVKFLGFIPEEELRAIYHLSQFLIMPSLFEAISLPIFDAWAGGIPVVCSNVTALPEQVLDAAVLFEPSSAASIADTIARVVTDEKLQHELRKRGTRRVKDFHWERTARAYRAVYRRAAGRILVEEDSWLLSWDWMREPRRITEGIPTARAASSLRPV